MLEPGEYVVALSAIVHPLDNTQILLEKLPISVADYLSFISHGYCDGHTMNSIDQIVGYVREHNPDRLAELKSVLNSDLAYQE